MRILTWNINGIRTILQYHPWNKTKNYKDILDKLGADIICFQETKITRSKLGPDVAMIPGYDAYFSFARVRQGYSGVVTYVKHPLIPLAAEEGITGVLHRSSPNDETPGPIGHYPSLPVPDAQTLDSEGRCVILDFGLFVLFNVYFPHLSGPERESFKSLFNSVLQCRVEALLDAGREVIVAGDVNICHREIDHCDPRQSCKDYELQEFGDQPARKWLDAFLAPNGKMVDMCRKFWPERKGMYTCWNTKTNARPANYGTRIDYILASTNLVPWFRAADILPDIQGSDHCPVVVDFHDEVEMPDDNGMLSTVRLSDRMHVGEGHAPPSLCAKYMEEYSEKQQKLLSFFVKKVVVEEEGGREDEDEDEEWTGDGEESSPENAGLVGLENSVVGDEGKEDPEAEASEATVTARVGSISASSPSTSSNNPAQPPSMPSFKRTASSSSSSSTTSKFAKFTTKSKPSSSNSQRTLTSFFKPSVASGTSDASATQRPTPEAPSQQDDADVDVDIKGLAAAAAATQATKSQWNELFAPRVVPLCRIHGEPCKEFTVGKKGPNQGRRFWLCSRPLGPEVTTTPDGREIKTTEYRCDYFEWSRASGKNSNEANGKRRGKETAEVGEREREKKK